MVWNLILGTTMSHFDVTSNTIAADILATQESTANVAMEITLLSRNIPVSAPKD